MKTPVVHIDFETRSLIDIKKAGAGKYAADPSTRILCVCWAVDNGPVYGSYGETIPEIFHEAIKNKWFFSAFNAIFEQLIWKYRWPSLSMPQFLCTRAMAAAHGLPQSLDRACKALHVGLSKDIEGRRLINTYSIPRKDGQFNELKGEDKKKMLSYCAKDVFVSRRIYQRLPKLSASEQEIFNWTSCANLRGLHIDTSLAAKGESIASEIVSRGNHELGLLTDGKILSVSQIQRIKTHLQTEFGIEAESLDKEAIEELLLAETIPDKARRILELRRDLSQTSVQKFKRASLSVCADGRVRDILVYHGAATGRWTSQVVQFQNLPKYAVSDPETALKLVMQGDPDVFELCYKHPMLALSGCIRGLVVPSKDKLLAVVDYNAIEARVLMWAAGQQDAIDGFHQGRDLYVEMARTIYNNPELTKADKKERTLGKTTILGCGYQMGYLKFQAACDSYGIDLGEKTDYTEREDKDGNFIRYYYAPLAKRAVETYRSHFNRVVEFWYGMQSAAEQCVRSGKPVVYGKFHFTREREFLYLELPSGRKLAYHRPGCDQDGLFYYAEDGTSFNYVKKRTYGGKLVENAIQATARDILAHGVINLERRGYPVLLTVHDENIVEIGEPKDPTWIGHPERALKEVIKIMCDLPAWAKGCPITAEGFVTERYRKG